MADPRDKQKAEQDFKRRADSGNAGIEDSSIKKAAETAKSYNKIQRETERIEEAIFEIKSMQNKDAFAAAELADKTLRRERERLKYLRERLDYNIQNEKSTERVSQQIKNQEEALKELNQETRDVVGSLSDEEKQLRIINKQYEEKTSRIEKEKVLLDRQADALKKQNTKLDDYSPEKLDNERKIEELAAQKAQLDAELSGKAAPNTSTAGIIGQGLASGSGGSMGKAVGGIMSLFDSGAMEKSIKRGVGDISSTLGGIFNFSKKTADNSGGGPPTRDEAEKEAKKKERSSKLQKVADKLGEIATFLGDALDKYVTNSANFMQNVYGPINASLQGLADTNANTYHKIASRMHDELGMGVLIKQTDYLNQIRDLTSQGISQDVETAALLAVVTDKTVNTFKASEGYLRRIVRMQDRAATQRFFGLEALLKRSLNRQFGDTSYLNELFDSVNISLKDAMTSLNAKNVQNAMYPFFGTTQSWLSALFETGVESNTITRIATVINALGSGNVQAMASDPAMQKLVLLAMDKAGMDYASVLQQGLTGSDVTVLLSNMVKYLQTIAKNTNANNVLEASYSNLFGISMSDMYALSKFNSSNVLKSSFNTGVLEQSVLTQLNAFGDERTLMSEKINNFMENMQFTFGADIASSGLKYMLWKVSKLGLDLINSIEKVGGLKAKAVTKVPKFGLSATLLGTAATSLITLVPAMINQLGNIGADKNSLTSLYNAVATSESTTFSSSSVDESKGFKGVWNTTASSAGAPSPFKQQVEIDDSWKEEEKDPMLEILKKFEETLMQNDAGKKAFAVSLEAMSNDVLRSFASIFADEDAMDDTFSGKNEVLKKQLFEYGDSKTTSSSSSKDGAASTQTKAVTGSN